MQPFKGPKETTQKTQTMWWLAAMQTEKAICIEMLECMESHTHCSFVHQTHLRSHYLHHTSTEAECTGDYHSGNLPKDCKSSPLQYIQVID